MNDPSPPTVNSCPRCGGSSAHPFTVGGVCLPCAGERVLSGEDFILPPPLVHTGEVRGEAAGRIGPYEIIEEIGRGGMGRVYAARQAGLGRIVALKVLSEDSSGVAGLELRFLREVQTAARLRHPHIVSVHDSGRAGGLVYYSMDYIDGGDLARRLRERPFTPRATATLLWKVADALAYTHREGVLHRDLKPSNILLDGEEPRLADFGLAAQLEPGGDLTRVTGVLGTPHYVAPEALRGGSAALTAASDLYAFGVVLYEMLAGRPPFAGVSPVELATLIETHEPLPLRLVAPAVPRDLETICLKCLERDPRRRYANAEALAGDLRRFLTGEPILASAPGPLDNFRKFARRHRVALAAAGAIAAVLLAATAISSWLAIRATRAEKAATQEAMTSKALSDYLRNDLLAQASPNSQPDRDIKLRTVLDRAAGKIAGRFTNQPLVEASIRETLAATHNSLGDFATEEHELRRALALRTRVLGTDDPQTLYAATQLAICLAAQGKLPEAGRLGDLTGARLQRTLGPDHPSTLHAFNNQTYIEKALGHLPAAEVIARRTLAAARGALGPDHEETRMALSNLSSVLWAEGRYAEAEVLNLEALAAFQRALGPEHPDTLSVMSNLASVYWSEEKLADAERINVRILDIRRRVLGPEHPETLRSMNNLATVYVSEGKFTEAVGLQTQTLDIRRRVLGPEHADTLSAMHNLAQTQHSEGRSADAIELCRQARDTALRALGAEHPTSLRLGDSLAIFLLSAGRVAEALPLATQVSETCRRLNGPDHATTLAYAETLGSGLLLAGRFDEAEVNLRDILTRRTRLAPDHWRTHFVRSQLAEAIAGQHRFEEAEPLLLAAQAALHRLAPTIPMNRRLLVTKTGDQVVRLYSSWGRTGQAEEWKIRLAAGATKPEDR